MSNELDERHRLIKMREYLGVHAQVNSPDFQNEVIAAAMTKVDQMLGQTKLHTGESVLAHLARKLRIKIETIRSKEELDELVDEYLHQQELGFGRLQTEFKDKDVYAVLFRCMNSHQGGKEAYVAVINSQEVTHKEYFSGFHEITHPILEPPQREFRFRRRTNMQNRVETLVDLVAGKIAFHPRFIGPLVKTNSTAELDWTTVDTLKATFAPTSSLMASVKGFITQWPRPAFFFDARLRRRKHKNQERPALRIKIQGISPTASQAGVFFPDNMRVPTESPAYAAYRDNLHIDGTDFLKNWTTSNGSARPNITAHTSARPYNIGDNGERGVYILISF